MGGNGGRRLLLAAAVIAVLAIGGGAAYALTPAALGDKADKVSVEVEKPDGTQPTSDEQAAAQASGSASSSAPSPSSSVSAASSPSKAAASVPPSASASPSGVEGCETGEKQQEVEGYLSQLGAYQGVSVDGVQSPADCAIIISFQKRYGINPARGGAGPPTAEIARRLAGSQPAAEQAKCEAGTAGVVACVDLTMQTVWVVRDGAVVFGPVPTRTGMSGYATPTGTYHVYDRSVKGWSTPYKVWLPYWQNFNGGIGFHATTTYLYDAFGSHGCVNLLYNDSKILYDLIGMNTTVKVFGHRSGT